MSRIAGLVAVVALSAAGCSEDLSTIPVSGSITLNGKPIDGASVVFNPVAEGVLAAGRTDAQGRYELRTLEKNGAPPGRYKVTVTLYEIVGQRIRPDSDDGLTWKPVVPRKYNNAATSSLEVDVPSKEGYDIGLTSP